MRFLVLKKLNILLFCFAFFDLVISFKVNSADFGTYQKPFAADSFWNSRPVSPTFSGFVIPTSLYNPTAFTPAFSATCYYTDANDAPVDISVGSGYTGVHDRDSETLVSKVTIPHWPTNVEAATGGDAHADVIDVDNRVIHSFWKLKNVDGVWTSLLYAWAPLDGRGWGDPAHYYQGARATGVPPCAGMIRVHEVDDGDIMFRHALAMSLTDNALSPEYTFPATSTDWNSSNYSGQIPEGALVMLPPTFDLNKIQTPLIKKIAATLKTYGAYVVDRNYGTPFVIYSEIGANTRLTTNLSYAEYRTLRSALRMVDSVQGWMDGNGNTYQTNQKLNILSMRGPWSRGYSYQPDSEFCETSCSALGKYNQYEQVVEFESTEEQVIQSNSSGRSVSHVNWARPKKGNKYQLTARATGGAMLRLVLRDPNRNDLVVYDSKNLNDGQSVTFTWPLDVFDVTVIATSGVNEASSVGGNLVLTE